MKKRNTVLTVLILLLLVFIWGNSCLPRTESEELSLDVVSVLWSFLPDFLTTNEANNVIRKLAHFSEFALLGALLYLRFKEDPDARLIPFSMAFSCAVVDETIQIFSGRGPSFNDVALDTVGAAAGIALILLFSRKKTKAGGASV